MLRLKVLLVAVAYILPQAGAFLHTEEALEDCGACDDQGPLSSIEHDDLDCGDPAHHHHQHHHPGTCRTCNAGGFATLQLTIDLDATEATFHFHKDTFLEIHSSLLLQLPIRAPPGSARSSA